MDGRLSVRPPLPLFSPRMNLQDPTRNYIQRPTQVDPPLGFAPLA